MTEVSSEHPQQSNDQIQEPDPILKKMRKRKVSPRWLLRKTTFVVDDRHQNLDQHLLKQLFRKILNK